MMDKTPRKPTSDELKALYKYYEGKGIDLDEVGWEKWVAVFDDYITDSVGYAGRVMVVVWGDSPTMYEAFTFDSTPGQELKVNRLEEQEI
jgi:hypothetical protein